MTSFQKFPDLQCDKCFSQSSSRNTHRKTHNKPPKPYRDGNFCSCSQSQEFSQSADIFLLIGRLLSGSQSGREPGQVFDPTFDHDYNSKVPPSPQLSHLSARFFRPRPHGGPHQTARRQNAAQMRPLRQNCHVQTESRPAHAHTHRREAVRVHLLRQTVFPGMEICELYVTVKSCVNKQAGS